jgi:hypothetical protein
MGLLWLRSLAPVGDQANLSCGLGDTDLIYETFVSSTLGLFDA